MEEIVLGGGCFWCIEAAFKEVEGVEEVTSGYAGGHTEEPAYREVCSGNTGHAEVVRIRFDENVLTIREILEMFFRIHDPTTEDREGLDAGTQYRSIILYRSEEREETVREFLEEQEEEYTDSIVTEVKELDKFYRAEEKHQDYFEKNPDDAYCRIHARPKVKKIRKSQAD